MSYANSDGARKKEKETIRVMFTSFSGYFVNRLRNVSGLSAGTGRQGRQAMHTDCRELFVDTM